MPMTPEKLIKIGRFLYGERWKTDLAKELPYSLRLVNYWVKNEREIPSTVAPMLIDLLNKKEKEIKKLKKLLEKD